MKHRRLPLQIIIPVVILCLALIIGYSVISSVSGDDSIAKDTVSKLKEMEEKSVSDIEAKMKEQAAEATTLSEEEMQTVEEYSTAELNEHYQGAVILGDSITDAIVSYEFLGRDVVVSKVGLRIAKADDYIETAIGLNPSTIFTCFGANDLETYEDDSAQFIEEYSKQIKKLQKALPGAKIYVNSIFPIEQSRIDESPSLGYYSDYNTQLEKMCTDLNCTYIDSTFLVSDNPNYYEPDGEHLVYDFYPKWLTYMALEAGI